MSHFSLIKLRIVNPNIQLLKETLREIVEALNGKEVEYIRSLSLNRNIKSKENYLIAFATPVFRRGVGVYIDENGEVKIEGDFWGIPKNEVESLVNMIKRRYTTKATLRVLKSMGYVVQSKEYRGKVYIKALARW